MPGRYYEDYEVGDVYEHAIRRTVTEADNVLFCAMTHNPQPLHLDEEFGKQSIHGTRIVNSIFTLAPWSASASRTRPSAPLRHLGFDEESCSHAGTARTRSTPRPRSSLNESKSRPVGIVTYEHRGSPGQRARLPLPAEALQS